MDFSQWIAPAVLFAIGFGAAVLARRGINWARRGRGPGVASPRRAGAHPERAPSKRRKRKRG